MTERDLGHALLTIARSAIAQEIGLPTLDAAGHPALGQPGATFVTLKRRGQLRGCIGSLRPTRPLGVDVRANALAAAFGDPRFPPLAAREFEQVTVEVSLLAADERIEVVDEHDLLARLRPGVDGLILEFGRQRATFLPQVWDSLPDPREFLAALKQKAGIPTDFWSAQINVFRYGVTKWTEGEFAQFEAQR
ncbi:MAG TPA: AmmeMemoRadiSam system protein A [Casimicrobiaceae bacterium]|nr:AmmeMemoRadiSam system protein A [Casimicrobiaceae bacterium]